MALMTRTIIAIACALAAAALMPPFFTRGACEAELDRVRSLLRGDQRFLGSPETAAAYFWRTATLPVHIVTAAACRRSKPSFVDSCGTGELLYVKVPVRNAVCRIYRDSDIGIRLQYDTNGRLDRVQSDMSPYRYIRLRWLGIYWSWGK